MSKQVHKNLGPFVMMARTPFAQLTVTSLCFHSAALGEFLHPCEDDIVCKCTTEENKVPYFNAPVYLENKEQIGKVDEIFGQLRDFVSFLLSLFQFLCL